MNDEQIRREVNQGMATMIVLAVVGYQAFVYACGLATGIH
jgi:hypothetical protein